VTETDAPTGAAEAAEARTFGSLGSIIGLLVLTWAAGLASRPLNDNSFFTHLATGRIILEDGRVPSRDPYTFTAAGEPWTVQSWLASVAYAGFERLAGEMGLRLLLLMVFLVAGWLMWRLTAPAASLLVRTCLVSAALLVGTGLWSERPYMIGVIGIAVVWLALDGSFPWWSPLPLLWVWGNVHGSFVLAVVLVAIVLAGGALDRGRDRWRAVPQHERRTAAAAAVGTLLVAAGPLGLRALTFPLVAAQRGDVFAEVTEWQAPEFRSPSEVAFLALALFTVAALARWSRSWQLVLPAVAFLGAALYAQRNVVSAAVVLVAVAARVVPAVGTLRGAERPKVGRAAATVMGVALVLVSLATLVTPASAVQDYAARPLAFLASSGVEGRVATDVLNGNLLEVLDGPERQVFVDDRFDLLPDPLFEDYLTLLRGRPGWGGVLDERSIAAVVWDRREPLGSLLSESSGWRIAYSDPTWIVAVRRA